MSKIHLLKDELINKIAAGEVVERPASVVKELVENAVDAEASEIRVELREGGKELIVVSDNGLGIAPEDAALAVKRHATSKIADADDLFAVDTLGFRGEALASIASVSHFSILTRQRDSSYGMKVEVDEGKIVTSEWKGRSGTTVTVKDLFHSIPVRRGFLKRSSAEYSAILEYMQAMALNVPGVGFTLVHNDRETLRVTPVETEQHDYLKGEAAMRERARGVFGAQEVDKLIYCVKDDKNGKLEALISSPGNDRGSSKNIFTFVNGRWVKDKTLRYGVVRGFHSHLLKGRHPFVILHLSIEPSLVDVNVHPSKTELRFQYGPEVQTLIATMIRDSIRSGAWAANDMTALEPASKVSTEEALAVPPKTVPKDFDLGPIVSRPKSSSYGSDLGTSVSRSTPTWKPSPVSKSFPSAEAKQNKPRDMAVTETRLSFGGASLESFSHPFAEAGSRPVEDLSKGDGIIWSSLNFIGSYNNCYLFFDLGSKLLVVDQHAFHERILYERFIKDYKSLGDSQRLLMPEALDLSPEACSQLEAAQDKLNQMGIEIGFVDGQTAELKSVPTLLKDSNFDLLLTELATGFDHGDENLTETGISHLVLSTMACHAAVRAGEKLGVEDVGELIKEADGIDFFLNCPHGRRVFRTFKRGEVEGWFDR